MNVEPQRFFDYKPRKSGAGLGGRSTDLFGSSEDVAQSPKRTPKNNYQKSSIFQSSETSDNIKRRSASPRHQENTASRARIFGEGEAKHSPRRINDTWTSSIFVPDNSVSLPSTPKRKVRNPITGEVTNGIANGLHGGSSGDVNGHLNGHTNGHANGHVNGEMNGHTNGHTNGHMNGHHDNGAHQNGDFVHGSD